MTPKQHSATNLSSEFDKVISGMVLLYCKFRLVTLQDDVVASYSNDGHNFVNGSNFTFFTPATQYLTLSQKLDQKKEEQRCGYLP